MSAENSASRGGRDVEADPSQPSTFQLPPELASQYQIRVIEPSDGSERRVGMFLPKDRDIPSIEIGGNGDRIVARNEDPETIDALIKIAKHNGWEALDVEGSPEFRKAVWAAGSRKGLTVRGYEPEFGERARIEDLRRAESARHDRVPSEAPALASEQPAREPAVVSAAVPTPSPQDVVRAAGTPDRASLGDAELSEGDRRLLLTVSSFTQDRQALSANLREGMDPMEREFQYERLDLNREALNGALERALESPTLVRSFGKSGYEPDDLRQLAREGAWDSEVADAIYLVRSGGHRHDAAKDTAVGPAAADEPITDREASGEDPARDRNQEPASGTQVADQEREHGAASGRRLEREELAELFLHGAAERVSTEPRLASALEAQAVMEKHLGQAFDGDANRVAVAALESRQMISDVLRRGLDVSVREPTLMRQIEPLQRTPDLER